MASFLSIFLKKLYVPIKNKCLVSLFFLLFFVCYFFVRCEKMRNITKPAALNLSAGVHCLRQILSKFGNR